MQVKRISMPDYELHHYDKEALQASGFYFLFFFIFKDFFKYFYYLNIATPLGQISVSHDAVLEQVRKLVNGLLDAGPGPRSPTGRIGSPPLNGDLVVDKLGAEWCFIDCKLNHLKISL